MKFIPQDLPQVILRKTPLQLLNPLHSLLPVAHDHANGKVKAFDHSGNHPQPRLTYTKFRMLPAEFIYMFIAKSRILSSGT
jgi:hypothetical protein